jgi:hypothetical protein
MCSTRLRLILLPTGKAQATKFSLARDYNLHLKLAFLIWPRVAEQTKQLLLFVSSEFEPRWQKERSRRIPKTPCSSYCNASRRTCPKTSLVSTHYVLYMVVPWKIITYPRACVLRIKATISLSTVSKLAKGFASSSYLPVEAKHLGEDQDEDHAHK